jgi:hypothetical protein
MLILNSEIRHRMPEPVPKDSILQSRKRPRMKPEYCPQKSLLIRFLGETIRVFEHWFGYATPRNRRAGQKPDAGTTGKKALYKVL